jgi:hypothetical protein
MRRVTLAFLAALALVGCDPVAGSVHDGPPAGGWPQPAGDRLTESMCGLLTKADYTRLGHVRRPSMWGTVNASTNSLDCQYQAGDELTLSLQPTAEFARYVFAADLQDHKGRLAADHRRSTLAGDVVGPADESWSDIVATMGTAAAGPELRLRRGALILGITLSGVRGKKEKDPRGELTELANLVLRRLPHVGAHDTGTTHKIEYEVVGTGRAGSIEWEKFDGVGGYGRLKNPRIPWLQTVWMATGGSITPNPPVLRVQASSPDRKVGCLIVVDGVPQAGQRPRKDFADCQAEVEEPSERAQPA